MNFRSIYKLYNKMFTYKNISRMFHDKGKNSFKNLTKSLEKKENITYNYKTQI